MSDFKPVENICKNCGHKLQYHLKEKNGKCMGGCNDDSDYSWCIANCQRFWK